MLHLILLLRLSLASLLLSWSDLADKYQAALTGQRDIQTAVPVDQLTFFGVALTLVVFSQTGYAAAALPIVQDLLQMKIGLFVLDLYYNEFTGNWQLCPAPIPRNQTADLSLAESVSWQGSTYECEPGFAVADLLAAFSLYFASTNTQFDANVVQLALNLHSITPEVLLLPSANASLTPLDPYDGAYSSYSSAYLAVDEPLLLNSVTTLAPYLFTPLSLDSFVESSSRAVNASNYFSLYPTQNEFLFKLVKRVIPIVILENIGNSSATYNVTSTDRNTLFFPDDGDYLPWIQSLSDSAFLHTVSSILGSSDNVTLFDDLARDTQFRMVSDDDETPFTNDTLNSYLQAGVSAVLNCSDYSFVSNLTGASTNSSTQVLAVMNEFAPSSFWSWAPGQPTNTKTYDVSEDDKSWYVKASSQSAYLCFGMTEYGWMVQNCYDDFRFACQSSEDPFDWRISDHIDNYFTIDDDLVCPDGYSVGAPRLSMEQFALLSLITSANVLYPIWIDMNDITVLDCFVTGGPYAECPYKSVVTPRNLIKNIAPSAIIALFILVLIFIERFFVCTPIHTNRKRYWKKTITEYYKENDYEGVPL